MKIGIIVAMSKELNLLLDLIENRTEKELNGFNFHIGNIGQHNIYAMQCGIGKVNSAIGTLTLIENFGPDLIINTGVAGGAGNAAKQMDIVVGKDITYHDVWCGPGNEYGCVEGLPLYYHSSERVIDLIKSTPALKHIKIGLICSGDKFISKVEEIDFIKSHFPDVLAVDMESASISQVCHIKNTPVLIFRIISDTPGEHDDNYSQYQNFWTDAPKCTFNILSQLLKEL